MSTDLSARRSWMPWAAVVIVAAILATLLVLEVRREVGDPGDSDYIAFATGARLVVSDPQHMYAPQAQAGVQAALLHIPVSAQFLNRYINLPAGALLLSPLAHLDLRAGASVAAVASLLVFGVCLILAMRLLGESVSRPARLLIAVSCVFSVPALDAVIQWDALLTGAVLVSVLLAQRKRYVAAELVLATLVLKPQTVWLVVPALVAAQSWRYLGGLALGVATWLAASVAIAGPASLVALVELIARPQAGEAWLSIGIPSLVAPATGSGAAPFVIGAAVGGAVTALLILGRSRLRGRPVTAVALGIPLSLLCAPHASAQDLMLVTATVILVGRRWPVLAAGEAVAFSVVGVIQQAAWLPARHLQPLVLAAVTVSAAMALLRDDAVRAEAVAGSLSAARYRALPPTTRADAAVAGRTPTTL